MLADPAGQTPPRGETPSQAPRTAGERALDCFLAAGFERIEPPILQPASIFLDMSGEEVRRRLFLTADAAGEELCLRPEYTIPVCRAYLASSRAGAIAEYSYLGPVFRARGGGGGEQTQTGLESFGRRDAEAADAEVLSLAMEAATAAGGAMLTARLGDAGLFDAVLDSLTISEPWRRRLRRGIARGLSLEDIFTRPSRSALAQPGVLAALESADHAGAKALVEDLLAIAGVDAVGGRTASEIADRFLEQASLRSGPPIEAEKRAALDAFLSISGDPDEAAVELRRLAHSAGLNLSAALDAFERRNGFIAARGVAIEATRFSAAFVRNFDYYTGFVFEAHDPRSPDAKTALAGGRYDGLARRLGAGEDIPAVGAAINLDRLTNWGER
jgi:ATP phosphoribosyltransferase regulatory subunit